eukprot:TRINITY_DN76838_c0_g1_i1.p1 TRINITY_DN76838_c0_g1~~TRINITY_DN76838_c0_g1_i1.p1  ORF type:complete len:635 (-),score=105.98 TRINITY_DN76838_c0_g1_i1:36-1916(-)
MAQGLKPTDVISFVAANPKRPGSKAFERYKKYCKAKTVAEALRLGAFKEDLRFDKSKGFLACKTPQEKGRASAKEKQTSSKAQKLSAKLQHRPRQDKGRASAKEKLTRCKAQKFKGKLQHRPRKDTKTSSVSGLAKSYVRDVPLSLPGNEEGQKLWKEMLDAGWRRCEFKFLAGVRKGLTYTRFVQPPAVKQDASRRLPPTGKSINGGFPTALKLYAKRDAATKKRVESILKRRTEMLQFQKEDRLQKAQDREACVQAYRATYGQLKGAADLIARHPGWQDERTAFVSPDGERFLKSKCTLNKDVEAHLGKHLLGSSRGRGFHQRVLSSKAKPVVKAKLKSRAAATNRSQSGRTSVPNPASYVKDVPLPASEGEGGQAVWKKMQAKGWRRCQFRFVSGLRKGQPYTRFIKPPKKLTPSSSLGPPTGASINGGFACAIKMFASASGLNVDKLVEQRMAARTVGQQKTKSENHQACVEAYRKKYGRLEDVASLLKRHHGWREKAEAFTSPDGQRFVKSMSANNLRSLLLDMEAHIGKKLLNPTQATSKPKLGCKRKVGLPARASQQKSKASTKVKAKSKADATTKNVPQIKALTFRLIKTLLSSGGSRCVKNKNTFSKELEALIDKQF